MGKQLRNIRGVHDGLPVDVSHWRMIEDAARRIFDRYGYSEVRLPVLEPTELFVRSIGVETDIVSKEMYRFEDRGGDDLCLRPEGTAGAVRAYLQAGLTRAGTQRWYYMGPMFRRERPQKGRLRQFQQIGVELFGPAGPVEDAEALAMARDLLQALGIGDLSFEINSLGCPVCRPGYRYTLVEFLRSKADRLCETCRQRIDSNPMRVMDCKVESCQAELTDAPEMLAHLCQGCDVHFAGLKQGLRAMDVAFYVNPRIVRGLDYYTRTAFEITTDRLGSQSTVIAGGRYDSLVRELGGPDTPAIGFALGLERLAMLLDDAGPRRPDAALVALGNDVSAYALGVAAQMRAADISLVHCGNGSAKNLFKRAHREEVAHVLVVGEDEMQAGEVTVKAMDDGSQQRLSVEKAIAALQAHKNG